MKKIICAMLALVMVLSLYACSGGGATPTDDTTNPETVATVPVTDDSGEAVTDDAGNTVTQAVTASTAETTSPLPDIDDEELSAMQDVLQSVLGVENATGEDAPETDTTGTTMPTGVPVEVTTDSSGKPVDPASESWQEILESGKCTINATFTTTMEGTTLAMPSKIIMNGDDLFWQTSINLSEMMKASGATSEDLGVLGSLLGMTGIKIQYLQMDGKYYMVIPSFKAYQEIGADEFLEASSNKNDFLSASKDDMTFIGASNVKSGGKTYLCEEYQLEDTVMKYYYLDGQLKRLETDNGEQSMIIDIKSISGDVDTSVFKIPSNYKTMEEWAENMEGLVG